MQRDQMDFKKFLPQILIFSLFFIGIISLIFSGLTITKAIIFQNEITSIFLTGLQTDVLTALIDVTFYILSNIVLPLLPFLIFSVAGVLSLLYFSPTNKELLIILTAVLFLSLLIKPSVVIGIICLGFFILIPIEFEEKKSFFKTARHMVSKSIRYFNISIAVALFFGIFLLPNFEKVSEEQMLNSINTMLPDIQELQEVQTSIAKGFIEQAYTDVNTIVDNEYVKLSQDVQTECVGLRDNIKTEVDNYKNSVFTQLETGEKLGAEETAKEVFSKIGMFSAISKSIPLTSAISIFFLLEFLKPLLALIGGFVYSVIRRKV